MSYADRDQLLHDAVQTGFAKRRGELEWEDYGFLCEGLAFAARPLDAGTRSLTKKYNLGPRGAFILNLLSNGVLYPLQLSNALCVGRSLITAEITRLTDASLISSRPGKVDRRRTELTLTKLGEIELEQMRAETQCIIQANLADYTPEEIRAFARMLRAVRGEALPGLKHKLETEPGYARTALQDR